MKKDKKIKALSLVSGGLDSLLATKLIADQGVHTEAINFFTGFAGDCPSHICSITNAKLNDKFSATSIAKQLGVKLHIVDVVEKFKSVLINPQFGYGANINPCLDCKVFMVEKAFAWMRQNDFDFIVTGEVIGQRPMSQRKDTMPIIAQNTEGYLLRPLCAKLLPETIPEREGWVNRELLYDFSGRNRNPQIELAKKLGIKKFPQPAGGCILTDPNYAARMRDLWHSRGNKDYSIDDIMLLKIGRHLRINPKYKIIIGRNESENEFLQRYGNQFISLQNHSHPGALLVIDGTANETEIELAARIAAYFSKGRHADLAEILITLPSGATQFISIQPLPPNDFDNTWYV